MHVVTKLIKSAKHVYYPNMINEYQSDQKVLFSSFAKVLHVVPEKQYPDCLSSDLLATSFADFFVTKILNIQRDLSVNPMHVVFSDVSCNSSLLNFKEISRNELSRLITQQTSKSCGLDPIPGTVMKQCFRTLLPTICAIFNLTLRTVVVPSQLKEAMIHPLLKKQTLPREEFSSFRPISKFRFLSKGIKKVVAS